MNSESTTDSRVDFGEYGHEYASTQRCWTQRIGSVIVGRWVWFPELTNRHVH